MAAANAMNAAASKTPATALRPASCRGRRTPASEQRHGHEHDHGPEPAVSGDGHRVQRRRLGHEEHDDREEDR